MFIRPIFPGRDGFGPTYLFLPGNCLYGGNFIFGTRGLFGSNVYTLLFYGLKTTHWLNILSAPGGYRVGGVLRVRGCACANIFYYLIIFILYYIILYYIT